MNPPRPDGSGFRLVLLRQQHDGLLEDLDFYVWLAEQEIEP